MSYEQYWFQDPLMARDYYKADRLRQERVNSGAWLQGAYVYDAILRLVPVLHAFSKKDAKPVEYLKEPYGSSEKEKSQEEQEQIVQNERLKAQLYFQNWARAAAKKFA